MSSAMANCSICFEDLFHKENGKANEVAKGSSEQQSDSEISSTPCGHVFHTHCVSHWIKQNRHCPQCRQPVLTSMLVKLFLEDQQNQSAKDISLSKGDESRFDTFIITPSASGGVDEARLYQTVLKTHVEDLEKEVLQLKKQLNLAEEQIHDKVLELSSLEADLHVSRTRESELERKYKNLKKELKRSQDQISRWQMDSTTARSKIDALNQELETKDAKIGHLGEKLAHLEVEIRMKSSAIVDMENRIEESRIDISSIYESIEDDDEEEEEDEKSEKTRRSKSKSQPSKKKGNCSCIKFLLIITILLAVILGIFVVLPLKLIFEDQLSLPQLN